MPIFFQQEIDGNTRLAIWKIEEEETFFRVPLQRDITHPHKRLQHLAGRYLLQYLFPAFPLDLIRIADTRKPFLDDEAFHFSISHCADYAAAIVSTSKRVGVDIEIPSIKVERIKEKFLHEEELILVYQNQLAVAGNAAPVENPITDSATVGSRNITDPRTSYLPLTLLWSAKEALYKWWSYGQVDFSEMIRIDAMPTGHAGKLPARFLAPGAWHHLQLHYRLFNNLCLAWVTD